MHYCFIVSLPANTAISPWCWLILLYLNYLSNCELNMSLLYCVVQSSFFVHDLAQFLLLKLELKGLSMIHTCTQLYERKQFSLITSLGKPTCNKPALPNQQLLQVFFCYSFRQFFILTTHFWVHNILTA